MAAPLYYDDLSVGQTFSTPTLRVSAEEIVAFARQFDPQPFHLDDAAAKQTVFGGLAASGWHTAALVMRLIVQSGPPLVGGIIGNAIDELRWLRPVRPGDEFRVDSEVLEMRVATSRPSHGRVRMRNTAVAEDGAVMSFIANLTVPRRQG